MLANKEIPPPAATRLAARGIFTDDLISRVLVVGLVCSAALFGALQTAACFDSSVQQPKPAAGAMTDATSHSRLIEVELGPLMVPVPEGDTEGSPFRPLPAPPGPASPMAIVPGIGMKVAPTGLDLSQPTSAR